MQPTGTAVGLTLLAIVLGPTLLRAEEDDNAALHYRKAFDLLPELGAAEKEVVGAFLTAPLDKPALALLKRAEPALQELRRGAALRRCDWKKDLSENGFDERTKHMMSASRVSEFACLRARHLWQQNDGEAAAGELAALITMARHYGQGGPYIDKVIQFAVENRAIDVAAASIPDLGAESLKALTARLAALPPSSTLKETVQQEKRYLLECARPQVENKSLEEVRELLLKWTFNEKEVKALLKAAGNDVKGLLKLIDQKAALYDELADIMMLPQDKFRSGLAALQKKLEAADPLAKSVTSMAENMRYATVRTEVRFAMLDTAVAIAQHGVDRLAKIKDPFGDGPFTYRPFKGGFELKSKLQFRDQEPVSLTVGIRKEK